MNKFKVGDIVYYDGLYETITERIIDILPNGNILGQQIFPDGSVGRSTGCWARPCRYRAIAKDWDD